MKNYVNTMELKKVYMIDPEATQGCLACLDKVKARRADIVRPFTQPERRLRRDQNLISTSFDRFAQDFLGCSSRTDVGAVKQCQTGIQAAIHYASRSLDVSCPPAFEEFAFAAEC